ncbi:hypothetical protein H2200_007620 [Cladophialophora chaetospira]|uniref:Uncharacterized protein n=1 Tax=Cladophialophora chaetospira TaxID=386627 RepID=A0AA39CGM7_9EURO|nr:hypothetical protein H2200_007620 [Cladophialophora chaetospira]
MSSPTRSYGFKGATSLLSSSPMKGFEDTENWAAAESQDFSLHKDTHQTPAGKVNTEAGMGTGGCGFDGESSSLPTPPDSGQNAQQDRDTFSVSSPFTFTTDPPVSTSTRPSQWSLRSRESSPSALLTTQTSRNREERKSKFLDRIRRRRDDERSEVVGDQVLRMDFVKERRGWEEQMARRAEVESLAELEAEEDDVPTEVVDDEEMSPTEEYDDLVREFEKNAGQEDDFLVDDVDDEDYERLFREMEIVTQQSQSQSQSQVPAERSQGQNQRQAERDQNQNRGKLEAHQQSADDRGGDDAMDIS